MGPRGHRRSPSRRGAGRASPDARHQRLSAPHNGIHRRRSTAAAAAAAAAAKRAAAVAAVAAKRAAAVTDSAPAPAPPSSAAPADPGLLAKGAGSLQPADHLRRKLRLSPTPPPPDRGPQPRLANDEGMRSEERTSPFTEAAPAVYRARGSGGGGATPDTTNALGGYVIPPPLDRCKN